MTEQHDWDLILQTQERFRKIKQVLIEQSRALEDFRLHRRPYLPSAIYNESGFIEALSHPSLVSLTDQEFDQLDQQLALLPSGWLEVLGRFECWRTEEWSRSLTLREALRLAVADEFMVNNEDFNDCFHYWDDGRYLTKINKQEVEVEIERLQKVVKFMEATGIEEWDLRNDD